MSEDFIFALDTDARASVDGKDGKADSFPNHPGETPTRALHKRWAERWRADLSSTAGFSSLMRGDLPIEIKKLADRDLIPEPSGGNVTIAMSNENIKHQNMLNKIKRDARLDEIKNRMAARIITAMRPKAPLRLKKLMDKHQKTDSAGNKIDNSTTGTRCSSKKRRTRSAAT